MQQARSPWRSGGFKWFFAGQSISFLGSAMSPVALALAVLGASNGDTRQLGLVLAANSVPFLLLLLVGGALADRVSQRSLLTISNLGAFATQSLSAWLLISGRYQLITLCIAEGFNGVFLAFRTPALRGIMPHLAEPAALQPANAARAIAQNAARVAGPALAGVMVATIGGGWCLAFDALTYFIAFVCFTQLTIWRPSHSPNSSLLTDVAGGFRYLRSLPWAITIIAGFTVSNFIVAGAWNVLGASLARTTIGDTGWGVILSLRAVGLLVASLAMYRVQTKRPLVVLLITSALFAVPLIALGTELPYWALSVAVLLAGAGSSVTAVLWNTTLQQYVETSKLSRVAAFDDLFSSAAVPAGQLAATPFGGSDAMGPIITAGGCIYAAALLLPLAVPSVRAPR